MTNGFVTITTQNQTVNTCSRPRTRPKEHSFESTNFSFD